MFLGRFSRLTHQVTLILNCFWTSLKVKEDRLSVIAQSQLRHLWVNNTVYHGPEYLKHRCHLACVEWSLPEALECMNHWILEVGTSWFSNYEGVTLNGHDKPADYPRDRLAYIRVLRSLCIYTSSPLSNISVHARNTSYCFKSLKSKQAKIVSAMWTAISSVSDSWATIPWVM